MKKAPTPHPDLLLWWLDVASARLVSALGAHIPEELREFVSDVSTHPFRNSSVPRNLEMEGPHWDGEFVESHWLYREVNDLDGSCLAFKRSDLPLILGLPGFVTDTALNLVKTL